MKYGNIVLEKNEHLVLKKLLNLSESDTEGTRKQSVVRLKKELETTIILDNHEMPLDVIRFNSDVVVATKDGWENTFTLVSATESDFSNKKISILSPMGLAIIGYAKGDIIDWEFPGGLKSLEIKDVKTNRKSKVIKDKIMELNTFFNHDTDEQIIYKRSTTELENWIKHLRYVDIECDRLAKIASNLIKDRDSRDLFLEMIKTNQLLLNDLVNYKNAMTDYKECDSFECDLYYVEKHEVIRRKYIANISAYRKLKDEFYLNALN